MMPGPSIWMIRISLIYLLIASVIGGLLLSHKAIDLHPVLWALLPLHYEMAIWGWMVQFVMGTAYWMFPKYLAGSRRGPEWAGWGVLLLFNIGLILYLLTVQPFTDQNVLPAIAGRGLILLSIISFAALMWKRVVSYRDQ